MQLREDGVPKPDQHEESGAPVRDTSARILYWWHMPERPGVGEKLLTNILVWFVLLLVVLAVIGVIVAVTG